VAICSLSFGLLFSLLQKNLDYQIKDELSKSNKNITDMIETAATLSIKNHLRAIAEKNREISAYFYNEFQASRMTQEEARAMAVSVILSQKVGDTGYLYCVNSIGVAVVHPKEGVVGVDFSNRQFVQAQIKKKEGYLEYDWKNPEEKTLRPKALYMTYFEPWDWIISASSYKSEFSKLISLDDFKEKIVGLTFGKTGYSFIIDTKGNILVHPEITNASFGKLNERIIVLTEKMVKQKRGFITYLWRNPSEEQDREKIVAFDSIRNFNWIIASSSYTEEIFAPLHEMKRAFLIILIFTLAITGVVTMVASASITKPLSAVIERFEKGAKGDWTSRIDIENEDEIGMLSASFNLFVTQLEAYRQELILENKVRKDAEKKLQTMQHYLSNIINSMPSVLIAVDINRHVSQWNKKAEELSGISMENALNRLLTDVYPQMLPHMQRIGESLKKKEMQHIAKYLFINMEQKSRYVDITIYPLTAYGAEGAVIRIDDITEKIMMEEVLIQNEKMLSIGGLAAGMAHEINNPLAGVIQNANVLSNRLTDMNIPANIKTARDVGTTMAAVRNFMVEREIPRMIESIVTSASRMASIVENMLSFVRKGDASFSPYCLADLMDKSLELAATDYNLQKHFDFKTITINKNYDENLPMVVCEGGKIQQVFFNILNNGAQAMFEKNSSISKNSEFTLRLYKDNLLNMLCMEIEDNGPGMDEVNSKRIFEPFFTTKPVGVGTGLGLSVAYFIITENHSGTISVESESGKGTTFIIKLPL